MKEQRRNQRGITLIALVITIIVLLILAGVSLSLVVGENGILNKATSAATETKKASLQEEVQLVLADWQTDYLINKTPYDGRSETTASGAVVSCTGNNITVVDKSGASYTTTLNNGQIGELVEGNVDTNSQSYKAMHPKVPTGFAHTEGEWNTGYVIKETATGDEFVWIPVVSEDSYVRKSGSRNWHMSKQDTDDCGKDVLEYVLGDKLELSTILGNTITETERNGETPANIPEKEVVCNAGGFYVSRYEIGIRERKSAGEDDAAKTAALARNQTSADWTKENLVSQSGKEPVRNIKQTEALAAANSWKIGENYQSGLITGTAWDTMCNFIGWLKCDGDCTSWGNYSNNLSKVYTDIAISPSVSGAWSTMASWQRTENEDGTRNIFQTGKFENKDGVKTDVKNIYDVAGNVREWTTEMPTQDATHRVCRGGATYDNGSDVLATYRRGGDSASFTGCNVGFRVVLYVK